MICGYRKDCKVWRGRLLRCVYVALGPDPEDIGGVLAIMRRELCQRMAARGLGQPSDCYALALRAAEATARAQPRSLVAYWTTALNSTVAAFMDEQQQKQAQQRDTPGSEVSANTLMEEWL